MTRAGTRRWIRRLGVPAALVAVVLPLAACDDINTVVRPDAPLVLTGADLPALAGAAPGSIVAFRHERTGDVPSWTQIPVQVDERAVLDFGTAPSSNGTGGVTGTVYGTSPTGITELQYTDAGTWVGPDPDATFDADDELVFMVADGGGAPRTGEESEPAGVVPGSGVEVRFDDPRFADKTGWVYLFVADAGGGAGAGVGAGGAATEVLDPSAGADYVTYTFQPTAGPYKSTYKRADGPNPETSTVVTPTYRVGFSDRWFEDEWRIDVGGATGVDILDGNKNRFHAATCVRSNTTFADGEGAFVANIDGPVRAIRSYVGANSGPLTERTHVLYRDREEIRTDLRVHSIPGVMDFLDYSPDAIGMTYASSRVPGGVTIDGSPDLVGLALPTWELVTGAQGSVLTHEAVETSLVPDGGDVNDVADVFYHDELNSSIEQCSGDPHFLGASGVNVNTTIPDTDPTGGAAAHLSAVRTVGFAAPNATGAQAAEWAATIDQPLVVSVRTYLP